MNSKHLIDSRSLRQRLFQNFELCLMLYIFHVLHYIHRRDNLHISLRQKILRKNFKNWIFCEMSYASYFIFIDIFKIKDKFIFNISCVPNSKIVSDSISQPISLSRKHSLARCLVRHNRLPNMPNHVTLINKSISGHIEA